MSNLLQMTWSPKCSISVCKNSNHKVMIQLTKEIIQPTLSSNINLLLKENLNLTYDEFMALNNAISFVSNYLEVQGTTVETDLSMQFD